MFFFCVNLPMIYFLRLLKPRLHLSEFNVINEFFGLEKGKLFIPPKIKYYTDKNSVRANFN